MTAPSNSGPYRVPCPHCQAPAGQPCSSRTGKKADTHQARWARVNTIRFTDNPITLRVTDWTRPR